MALEDSVSVVALVVSLVALLIATTQAGLQLFSTAEGYRKCAPSIIGPWSRLRHRKFIWSEMRLATEYVTPHITIVTPAELVKARNRNSEQPKICLLSMHGVKPIDFVELDLTLHSRNVNVAPNLSMEKAWQSRDVGGVEAASNFKQPPLHLTGGWSQPLVSWLLLLRETHRAYTGYRPGEWNCHLDPNLKRPDLKQAFVNNPREERTDVGVIYRKWSWDLMPDVTRPLATSTVGNITVLALRLGMQWDALDPGRGAMQASGNGYSLSGTEVRGLGMLLSFTVAGDYESFPPIVPSRAVDKMMCGIIPGCCRLVKKDFAWTGRDHQPMKSEVLQAIGISDDARNQIIKRGRRIPNNDLVILLCPFLPQSGCHAANHLLHGWTGGYVFTPFYLWEGKLALLRGLQERKSTPSPAIEQVLSYFIGLSVHYEADLFCRKDESIVLDNHGWEAKERFLAHLQGIHEFTTAYFQKHGYDQIGSTGSTKYLQLVAAHLSMANETIETVNRLLPKIRIGTQDQISRFRLENVKYPLGSFFQDIYEYAKSFVESLDHPDYGVVKYYQERFPDTTKAEVEEAWWVMVLRGVSWAMSTQSVPTGEPIPAYLYGNQTPVWIT